MSPLFPFYMETEEKHSPPGTFLQPCFAGSHCLSACESTFQSALGEKEIVSRHSYGNGISHTLRVTSDLT